MLRYCYLYQRKNVLKAIGNIRVTAKATRYEMTSGKIDTNGNTKTRQSLAKCDPRTNPGMAIRNPILTFLTVKTKKPITQDFTQSSSVNTLDSQLVAIIWKLKNNQFFR